MRRRRPKEWCATSCRRWCTCSSRPRQRGRYKACQMQRLPGFNLQTSVVFGPATQKPQAACRPHAISAGAAVCHHGACSARPNHQGRRTDRFVHRTDRKSIHGLRRHHPRPRSWEAANFSTLRRRAIPKRDRPRPGSSASTPARGCDQLARVAGQVLWRACMFRLHRA